MFLASWAKLANFHPAGMNSLVLGDRVVAALTLATRQDDGLPWHILRSISSTDGSTRAWLKHTSSRSCHAAVAMGNRFILTFQDIEEECSHVKVLG